MQKLIEQNQMSLMEITRKLTRIEEKLDKILTFLMTEQELPAKTPEEWKQEKIQNPCPNWWSQNPMNPTEDPKIPY